MHEAEVLYSGKWSDNMKNIILENDTESFPHLNSVKGMAEKLKAYSRCNLS